MALDGAGGSEERTAKQLVTHFSGDKLILESGGIFPKGSVPYWDYASVPADFSLDFTLTAWC